MTETTKGGFFDSHGVPIHYIEQGRGPAVVLLHGLTLTAEFWVKQSFFDGRFAGYRLIAMDCRGHGQSGKPHAASAYGAEMAEDVLRLFDHLRIERAHLIGHSMGAEIALKVVALHPDRVASVCMAGSAWSDERIYALWDLLGEGIASGKGLGLYMRAQTPPGHEPPTEEEIAQINSDFLAGCDLQAIAAVCRSARGLEVSEEQVRAIRAPLLGVPGELDAERPAFERLIGVAPTYRQVLVEGEGHMGAKLFRVLAEEALKLVRGVE